MTLLQITQDLALRRVACTGHDERGSETLATERVLGWPLANFADVAAMLASGQCDLALVPIHHTGMGEIVGAWAFKPFAEVATFSLPADVYMFTLPGTRPSFIREVRSHPLILRQCQRWLLRSGYRFSEADDALAQAREITRYGLSHLTLLGPAGLSETGLERIAGPLQDLEGARTTYRLLRRA